MNQYAQYSDEDLVRLLSQDDEDAFKAIYERYWENLYDNAYHLTRDEAISKDILQDIFVWLWEKRVGIHITFLKSYLKTAVKFKVANAIRSGNIRESFYEEIAGMQFPATEPTPEELAEINELKKLIHQAVSQLPNKCREIYLLRREAQLSNQEIADRLHLSLKTVENQITIAQKKIRESLEPYMTVVLLASLLHITKIF